jgi:hypothetical protein
VREPRPLASEPPRHPSPYLTAKEAAAYLRIPTVDALYKAIAKDGIPVRPVMTRYRLFRLCGQSVISAIKSTLRIG